MLPFRDQWQWRGAPHSPKLQHHWNLAIWLFSVISRTVIGGGGSSPSAEVQSVYSTAPADWAKLVMRKHKCLLHRHINDSTNGNPYLSFWPNWTVKCVYVWKCVYYYVTQRELFAPILADSLSPESEWYQVSSSPQDSISTML